MNHITSHIKPRLTLLLLSSAALLLILLFVALPGEAKTWYVDDDATPPGLGTEAAPFVNISQGLAVAHGEDTIFVFKGEYNESLLIEVPLTLEGEWSQETTITGPGGGPVVTVEAERVRITGFTISSETQEPGSVGVLVSEDSVNLQFCEVENNNQGVVLEDVEGTRVENCFLLENTGAAIFINGICPQTSLRHNWVNYNGAGVHNNGDELVDASGCWWGNDDGPGGVGAGTGNSVSSAVDFTPWIREQGAVKTDSDGYQPDFTVLNVDDDSPQFGQKGRIQEGIDMVQGVEKNRKVWVQPGSYNESIVINKTLHLQAHSRQHTNTTINGGGKGDVVRITADGVRMNWFTVTGSGKNWGDSGVELAGVSNCWLSIIYSQDNFYGFHLLGGGNNWIDICRPQNNQYGIRLWKSHDNMLYMPYARNNEGGIFLYGSVNNTVYLGLIEANKQNGIYLWEGSNNNYIGNTTITGNDHGIDIYHSSNNAINYSCTITDNDVGLRFSLYSRNNTVENNSIENNHEADIQVYNNLGPAGEGLPDPNWEKDEEEEGGLLPLALVALVVLGVFAVYLKKDELLPKG